MKTASHLQQMTAALRFWLISALCLAGLQSWAATETLSQLARTNTTVLQDDLIINATNNGSSTKFTSKRIKISDFLAQQLALTNPANSFAGNGNGLTNISGTNVSLANGTNAGTIDSTNFVHVGADSIKGNELGRLPPMGWNSWYGYGTAITEAIAKGAADALRTNLYQYGYKWVTLDEGWATNVRSATGDLMAMSNKFTGLTLIPMSDYCHTNNPPLYFGMYLEKGPNTLASAGTMPSAYASGTNHYDADFSLLSSWNVDYVKCDGPAGGFETSKTGVKYFSELYASSQARCGRPMVLNSSVTGQVGYQPWLRDTHNIVRLFPGFGGTNGTDDQSYPRMLGWIDWQVQFRANFGPYFHPDLDPLDSIFNISSEDLSGAANAESRTHMGMSALIGAPLLLTEFSPSAQHTMFHTNMDVIGVDQDPLCYFAEKIYSNALTEIWSKKLANTNSRAIGMMNRNTNAGGTNITLYFTNAGLPSIVTVRDLWVQADIGWYTNSFTTNVGAHDLAMLKVSPGLIAPLTPGTNYLSDLNWAVPITNSIRLSDQADLLFGPPKKDKNYLGNALVINGVTYTKGIGTVAEGELNYWLGGLASSFHASFGVDDAVSSGGGQHFVVKADGTTIFDSGTMQFGTATVTTNLNLAGVQRMKIQMLTTQGTNVVNMAGDIANSYFIVDTPLTKLAHQFDWASGNRYDVDFASLPAAAIIQTANGVVTAAPHSVLLSSSTTAGGLAAIKASGGYVTGATGLTEDNNAANVIDWSQPVTLGCSFSAWNDGSLLSTKGFFRVTAGTQANATNALWSIPGESGIGIEVTNGFKLTILTCNDAGTITRTNTNITVTHSAFTKHTAVLNSLGNGTVACYYDGAFIGYATGGPRSLTSGGDDGIVAAVGNGGDTSGNAWMVYSLKLLWGQ